MESQSFFKDIKDYLPGQSIDCVIIGYDNHELHILVLKWKNMDIWTLPGGFVEKNEDMNNAAIHVLKDRTGLSFPFLDQFYTFGNVDRGESKVERNKFLKQSIINDEMRNWLRQRFITTGYFALVDIKKCNLKADIMSELCEWRPIDNLPNLIFDHREIITKALDHIRIQINYLP